MLCVRIARENILPGDDVSHSLMIGSPELGPLPNFDVVMRHSTAVDAGPALFVPHGWFFDCCVVVEMRHCVQEWIPDPLQGLQEAETGK